MKFKIEYFNEGDKELARIHLKGSDKLAVVYVDDLLRLEELDVSLDNWRLRNNQVTTRYRNRDVSIPRLIRHALAGQRVICIDGDGTNLRSDNLALEFGASKFDSVAIVTQRKDEDTAHVVS